MKRKTGCFILMLSVILAGCSGAASHTQAATVTKVSTSAYESSEETTSEETTKEETTTSESEEGTSSKSATEFTDCDKTGYIKSKDEGGVVNIRKEPSTDAEVVDTVLSGKQVHIIGESKEWYRIDYNGEKVYIYSDFVSDTAAETTKAEASATEGIEKTGISLSQDFKYASNSKINSGTAMLYKNHSANANGKTVCVNAGHGTTGGESVKTLCHPDGTAKVTGGSTAAGATSAMAVSSGMTFADGTAESIVTLRMAVILRDKLLEKGYNVLMIRESNDVQLDNIARTVLANHYADCHLALHWDSTSTNKGAFYMGAADSSSYRAMEPVKSHWQQHDALGNSLMDGLKSSGIKIFSNGYMGADLTQISYSTIPSVDLELGDKASDHSDEALSNIADGLVKGIDNYFS